MRNKIPTHAQPTQARTPAFQAFAAGATLAKNYHRLHNRRRRDACYPGIRRGGDSGKKSPTPAQPSQARRLLSGHSLRGRLWQKLPPPAQPSQATVISSCAIKYQRMHNRRRRDACFLCFAERLKAIAGHSPWGRLWVILLCETQHHPLRGLCTFDTTYLGLVLTDFTRG